MRHEDLDARRALFASAPDAALAGIDDVRRREEQGRNDWTSYGVLCVGTATALIGGGALGVAGGGWLAANMTEEVDAASITSDAGATP